MTVTQQDSKAGSFVNDKEGLQREVESGSGTNNDLQEELPLAYYITPKFLGSYFALVLTACNLYVSYTIPVRIPKML